MEHLTAFLTRMPKVDAEGRTYKIPHVGWNSIVPPTCRSAEPADAAGFPGGTLGAPSLRRVFPIRFLRLSRQSRLPGKPSLTF